MGDCGVCLQGYDFEPWEFFNSEIRKARKAHTCAECGETILPGQSYEHLWAKADGTMSTQDSCLMCVEIAEAFYCDGRAVGVLWEDMEDVMADLGTSCFDKLQTPEAKALLQRRWMQWKGLVP